MSAMDGLALRLMAETVARSSSRRILTRADLDAWGYADLERAMLAAGWVPSQLLAEARAEREGA